MTEQATALHLSVERDAESVLARVEGTPPRHIRSVMTAVAAGARWEPSLLAWRYPYSSGVLISLEEAAKLLPASIGWSPALDATRAAITNLTAQEHAARRLIQAYIDNPDAKLGDYITSQHPPPWRHQRISWHWAMRTATLYLAHKPGLGKSRSYVDIVRGKYDLGQTRVMQAMWLDERRSIVNRAQALPARWGVVGGVLIVCPAVVLDTIEEELFVYQGIEALVIRGGAQAKMRRAGTPSWIHIVNYESLESVEGNVYDGVVADEAHYLANDESQRWQRMMALRQSAQWVLAGSGTPVSNMLPSLWAQFLWLDGGRSLGSSQQRFIDAYFEDSRAKQPKADADVRIAQAIARVTYFLRKEDALPDLPPKILQPLYFPMTRQQADYYERIRKDAAAEVMTGRISTTDRNIKLMKLLQVCQGFVRDDNGDDLLFSAAKLTALEGMLTGSGDLTDRKVIVWCRFLNDIDAVAKMLARHGVEHLRYQGEGMSANDRDVAKYQWNHDAKWRVLIGTIMLGIGVNLHARDCVTRDQRTGAWLPDRCSTTVFYGIDWSATNLEQSMDRVHRGDQVETCLYRFLLSTTPDSTGEPSHEEGALVPLDVKVYRVLQEKLRVAGVVHDEGQDYYRRLLARG